MIRQFAGPLLAATLFLAPGAVQAEDCGAMLASRASADRDGSQLVRDNPGTGLVALACIAVASSDYDQTRSVSDAVATFGVCGGIGCAFIGGDCLSIGSRIIFDAVTVYSLGETIRQTGCDR